MKKKITLRNNIHISYDVSYFANSPYTLVFLHGVGGDLRAWDDERSYFSKQKISTLAIDLRGHGKSDRPKREQEYKIKNFAMDVRSVIQKENLRNYILVGHCFGGMVAVTYHRYFPKSAKAYVLIDTASKSSSLLQKAFRISREAYTRLQTIHNQLQIPKKDITIAQGIPKKWREHNLFKGTGEFNLRRIYSDIVFTGLKSWLLTYEAVAKYNGESILKRITQPVLILQGEDDIVIPKINGVTIKRLTKKSSLRILKNENHIVVLNNPKIIFQEISLFIKKLSLKQK